MRMVHGAILRKTTHVGHPGCLRGYFVEQDARDRRKVASRGGELRQHRLPSRDQRVHDRHGWARLGSLGYQTLQRNATLTLKPATGVQDVIYIQQDSRQR